MNRQAGFTLLELLVAMTVLALVLGFAAGAIGFVGQGFGRGTERVDRAEQIAVARDVLRRQAARAFPLATGEPGRERLRFTGDPRSTEFIIAEPPAPGRGGLALARFAVEASPLGQRLVYRQAGLDGKGERSSILAEGPYGFAFDYLDPQPAPGAAPAWTADWTRPEALPVLIRLRVTQEGRELPAAIVGFRVDAKRDCLPGPDQGFCRDRAGGRP